MSIKNSMVKYGKGVNMTRKMTITLEDEILDNLDEFVTKNNKKKQWEEENKEAIDSYNKMVEEDGIILKHSRMF